jgi:hypothetical protein
MLHAVMYFIITIVCTVHDCQAKDSEIISLYFENDFFFKSDDLYTNGVKLSWTSAELESYRGRSGLGAWALAIMDRYPDMTTPDDRRYLSLSLGQNIYTPENTEETEWIKDDRPYAGLIYLGVGVTVRGEAVLNHGEAVFGLVGPNAHAEWTQSVIHDLFENDKPRGWDNQLENEPVLNLYGERRWQVVRSGSGNGAAYEVFAHTGAGLGNLFIGVNSGLQLRLGWRLPDDFGTRLIRPGPDTRIAQGGDTPGGKTGLHRIGAHLFVGARGDAVLRNLTLDGNTTGSGPGVEKEPLVGTLMVGVGLNLGRWEITLAHVYQTREYESQSAHSEYGSIVASFVY